MLDWIQDWESNKTTIGSTYILTPKIFVGKKVETAADLEALCGVYIGPDSPLDTPHAGSGQTELESLASLMGTLRSYMQSHFGDTNYAKWSQIYYPAASAAYAYEPQVSGVTLADKFKAHNWFLPAEGLLIRLCWWFRQGATSDNNIFKKAPTETVMGYVKAAWNFLYWHNPRIKYYLGNVTQFLADGTVDNTYCYWMTEGNATAAKYELYRWEELTESSGQWVKAGMWDSYSSSYAARNLQTDTITASAITTENQNQYAVLNKAFIAAIVAHAKANIGSYFKESSLKFHYAYVNFFIAGTDNCSKNTYYVLDPSTHLFELHQDDLDTIFATDNNGRQTKPYYIDRMHPYAKHCISK